MSRFTVRTMWMVTLIGSYIGGYLACAMPQPDRPSEHLGAGQPTRNEHFLAREGYVGCWDDVSRVPRWIQYRLKKDSIKPSPNSRPAFRSDPDVGASPSNDDYHGFDKGHLYAFADAFDPARRKSSMLLTNVAPQASRLNRGSWARFEAEVRDVAKRSDEVYVVVVTCGYARPSGSGISVPDRFAKIVAARHGEKWKVLTVIADNTDLGQVEPTTKEDVERQSGFRFMSKISGDTVAGVDDL